MLADCSGPGMALTGFTRNGKCVDKDDDAGSHHVCIEMDSSEGSNFCTVTGQPNWCDDQMPCADGAQPGGASEAILECPVRNWCVCEWAFRGYIGKAGGCSTRRITYQLASTAWRVTRVDLAPSTRLTDH